MKAYLLAPSISLVDAIAEKLVRSGKDYSKNMVVFPGKRPSHFLLKKIAGLAAGSFVPPVILSMDEFIDRAYRLPDERLRLNPLDVVAILYDIHTSASERIGGEGFKSLDTFFPIGLKLYSDLEELFIEQISVARLRDMGIEPGEKIPDPSLQRIAAFEIFYEELYRRINAEGRSTRSMRYRKVAGSIAGTDFAGFATVIFAGFFALTATEKLLFKKIAEFDQAVMFFQSGPYIREMLETAGIPVEELNTEEVLPRVVFTSSPDSHGQVFALADMIENMHASGTLDETSAVVLPTAETLFPLLRHGLTGLEDDEYNISLGYPLVRTPLFGFLQAIMELVAETDGTSVYLPSYLSFVLHPYTKNIYFKDNSEITRIIFHAIDDYYSRHNGAVFVTLDGIEGDEELMKAIMKRLSGTEQGINAQGVMDHLSTIHDKTIRPFLGIIDVNDFSKKCIGLFSYIAEQSSARLHPLFSPFCEAFIEALDAISISLIGQRRFDERSSYFIFFKRYLMTRHAPFQGTPLRGLQVLGLLETRSIRFERLFVIDANEDILPDTRREDSLIPGMAREMLGLPTYHDRERLAAYHFDVIVKGAKEVHLFFTESDKAGKSRFAEKMLWEMQLRDRKTDSSPYVRSLQYRVQLENGLPQPVPKSPAVAEFLKSFSYSATALDTYLACPIGFYYQFVLRLSEQREASGELDRSEIGSLVHEVLASYFSRRLGRVLNERDLDRDEMAEDVSSSISRMFGDRPVGRAYLLMKQIQRRLDQYLEYYFKPIVREMPVSILAIEQRINANFRGFWLNGKLDAVQKRGERLCIMDYKTAANRNALRINFNRLDPKDRNSWSNIGSLQLPLYRMLYEQEKKVDRSDIDAMFLVLGMMQVNRDIEVPLFRKEDNSSESSALIDDVLFRLLAEITDPTVSFCPASDLKKNCPVCAFADICGTKWVSR
jgi:hypothetical protein